MTKSVFVKMLGSYKNSKLHEIFRGEDPGLEGRSWSFYFNEDCNAMYCLRSDIFNRLYIKTGGSYQRIEVPCIAVGESNQRLRVAPFMVAPSPQGDDQTVGFEEVITGKLFAMSLKDFNERYKIDVVYNEVLVNKFFIKKER